MSLGIIKKNSWAKLYPEWEVFFECYTDNIKIVKNYFEFLRGIVVWLLYIDELKILGKYVIH